MKPLIRYALESGSQLSHPQRPQNLYIRLFNHRLISLSVHSWNSRHAFTLPTPLQSIIRTFQQIFYSHGVCHHLYKSCKTIIFDFHFRSCQIPSLSRTVQFLGFCCSVHTMTIPVTLMSVASIYLLRLSVSQVHCFHGIPFAIFNISITPQLKFLVHFLSFSIARLYRETRYIGTLLAFLHLPFLFVRMCQRMTYRTIPSKCLRNT